MARLVIHYMVGFERLNCQVYYVEDYALAPTILMEHADDDCSAKAAQFLGNVMRRFDLSGSCSMRFDLNLNCQ